jgi:pimeloyl-ACP methyl ester carboxylesterase
MLSEIRSLRSHVRPAEQVLDGVYLEAALWAALRDTAMAVVVLDSTLEALRWTEPAGLAHGYRAAALIWAMALRADIAAASGDAVRAARWARPVVILWADADEHLQPVVARMRAIVERAPRSLVNSQATSAVHLVQHSRRR